MILNCLNCLFISQLFSKIIELCDKFDVRIKNVHVLQQLSKLIKPTGDDASSLTACFRRLEVINNNPDYNNVGSLAC